MLARYRVRVKRILLILVLMTQMFPLVVLVIPLFVIMRKSGLLGTYWSLIFTYLAFSVPLAIWVMRGFIMSIPEELEHAARIDGATRIGAMWRVVLPLAAPGLAVTAVLCFLEGWKEFLLALTFINEEERKTVPLVLQTFVGRGDTDWGAVMATSVLYTLPVALVFVLARKHLMTARTAGAVKRVRATTRAARSRRWERSPRGRFSRQGGTNQAGRLEESWSGGRSSPATWRSTAGRSSRWDCPARGRGSPRRGSLTCRSTASRAWI